MANEAFQGFTDNGFTGDRLKFAIVIEGWPEYWTTYGDHFDGSSGDFSADEAAQRDGLMFDGLGFSEQLDIREHTIITSPMTFAIRSTYADASFGQRPTILAHLTSTITNSDTSMSVSSITNFSNNDYIHVGTEALQVTSTPSGSSFNIQRAVYSSQAQHHKASFGAASNVVYTPIYDRPASMEGRLVYLWASSSVMSQADGDARESILWRGVVKQAPTLDSDGVTWLITAEPITSVLDQELAATSDTSTRVRGIYHPWNHALYVRLIEIDRDIINGIDVPSGSVSESRAIGHWETEEEFADGVASNIAADLSFGYSGEVTGLTWGFSSLDGMCELSLETGDRAPQHPNMIQLLSELEGHNLVGSKTWEAQGTNGQELYNPLLQPMRADTLYTASMGFRRDGKGTTGLLFNSMLSGPAGPHRGIIGHQVYSGVPWPWIYSASSEENFLGENLVDDTQAATYPEDRIYLQSNIGFDSTDGVVIIEKAWMIGGGNDALVDVGGWVAAADKYAGEWGVGEVMQNDITLPITALSTSDPYVEVDITRIPIGRCLVLDTNTKIYPALDIGQATDVGVALQNVLNAAQFANQGSVPFLTGEHIAITNFKANVVTAAKYAWQKHRYFRFKKPVLAIDWLREELKMLNMHFYIDADGKLDARQFVKPTSSSAVVKAIDESGIVSKFDGSGDWPSWVANPHGVVNTMQISRGYRPRDDSHVQDPITVRDIHSIAHHKNRGVGVQKIEPKSGSYAVINEEDIQTFANQYFGWFAEDYFVVELACTYKYQDLLIGDIVSVTHDEIIDPDTGTRGVSARRGILIGRSWNFNPRESEQGRLMVLLHRELTQGYAPSLEITAASDNGSDNWTLTVTQNEYGDQTGDDDTSFFANGYHIRAVEYNQSSPGSQTGTVSGTPTATTIIVQFDGAAPWGASYAGGDDYRLEFRTSASAAVVASGQEKYIYVADSGGLAWDNTYKSRYS